MRPPLVDFVRFAHCRCIGTDFRLVTLGRLHGLRGRRIRLPLSSDTLLSSPTTAAYRGSGLYDFALCLNVQIPVGRRWEPYGILAAGLLYNVYQAAVLTPAGTGFADRSKTNFEFSTGGGVRYYVADNWGIRPEVRVFISGRNFTRISVGVFYDIDADWPFRIRRNKSSRHWRHLP